MKAGTASILALVLTFGPVEAAFSSPESRRSDEATVLGARRLTESQYRQSIADALGPDIRITGRFEPDLRRDGLLAIGASRATITPAGAQQFFAMARQIADQAVRDPKHPGTGCVTAAEACDSGLVQAWGRALFRRPLSAAETSRFVAIADEANRVSDAPDAGRKAALTAMLVSPAFLFRLETGRPEGRGSAGLDDYSYATRLSYLLWNAGPDDALLAAASMGQLRTPSGRATQVDRMMRSPRFEVGMRAFFDDWLQLDGLKTLTKEPTAYPRFSSGFAEGAREQALRLVVDQLLARDEDFRDLFTTRRTFINRNLAAIYDTPYDFTSLWQAVTLDVATGRVGIQTQAAFLAQFSHPGRTSPTRRGVAVLDIFLCLTTSPPPPDVDTSLPDVSSASASRARLAAHARDESCASCHEDVDAVGLALEGFDSLAQPRGFEDGKPLNLRVQWSGRTFEGAPGLGSALHDDPRTSACLVRRMLGYATGRSPAEGDAASLRELERNFAASGRRLRTLVRSVALSPALRRGPDLEAEGLRQRTASLPVRATP